MTDNEIVNADRLFINESGHFVWSARSIPALNEHKSCVTVADIDKDGDTDVFVDFLSNPMKYGMPQNSYLYLNDGHGKFQVAPSKTMNLLNIGMVTDAAFTDVNKDGWPDPVLAGKWMPEKTAR